MGNRFDDPLGDYRALYASEQRRGTFAETLARFRPDMEVISALREIKGDPANDDHPAPLAPDIVPSEWLDARALGTGTHAGRFVDIGQSRSVAHLRSALSARVLHYGFGDLDAGDVRRRVPRALMQEISRYAFVRARDASGRPVAGFRCRSRLGDDLVNWAIFETEPPSETSSEPIDESDPDLGAVFAMFELAWG